MLVEVNKHGSRDSNGGSGAKNYLLGKDNDRENARLLKGDPELTTEIINGLNFSKIYTSGGIYFAHGEGDKLTEQDKLDIINDFEKTMFPNLEPSQVSGYWVEHTDKVNDQGERRLELNFVYANVDLESGKALPVYYHQNDKHLVNAWRDYTNIQYDLIDPNAIERQQTLKISKQLPQEKKEILESVHDLITNEISKGKIENRQDIIKTLDSAGIELASKPTAKYISIKYPDKNIRLRGAIYDDPEWTIDSFIKQVRNSETAEPRAKLERLRDSETELGYSINKRRERFETRFKAVSERSKQALSRPQRAEHRRTNDLLKSLLEPSQSEYASTTDAYKSTDRTERKNRTDDFGHSNENIRFGRLGEQFSRSVDTESTDADRRSRYLSYIAEHRTHETAQANNELTAFGNRYTDYSGLFSANSVNDNLVSPSKTEIVFQINFREPTNSSSLRFSGLGDRRISEPTGRSINDKDSRADNQRGYATNRTRSQQTSTPTIRTASADRDKAITELERTISATTNIIADYAKQSRPSPFDHKQNGRATTTDDEDKYTYDRDRDSQQEPSERIEWSFRQIDNSIAESNSINEKIIKQLDIRTEQAQQAEQQRQQALEAQEQARQAEQAQQAEQQRQQALKAQEQAKQAEPKYEPPSFRM